MIRIKIYIVSAGGAPAVTHQGERVYQLKFDEGFAQRFIKHLKNDYLSFCTACGEDCIFCRDGVVEDLSDKIAGHLKMPLLTDQFIDEPDDFLPDELPAHDVTIAINIHSDLLLELPNLAVKAGSKALIVPVEDPDWLGNWTKGKLEEKCFELGLEFAAPKPFCSLNPGDYTYIKQFIEEFKIGRPKLDLIIKDGVIERVDVQVSAPCGATYYLARIFEGLKADERIIEVACKGLSSYPCTASTKVDPEFKDSITHKSNYIMIDILKEMLVGILANPVETQ
ncbi:MAG: hypothetical protein K6T91_06275 [Firmicutes bacterium]|nr:hypothetical protein [Bacillota bacterium]